MRKYFASPSFRKYFANTSWLLGERILRMIVSLFVGIYVARYLGPERFGLLSYSLSFVFLFSSLASFGLDDILVRELVQRPEQRNNLLGTVFWLKVCGTIVMGFTIAMVLHFKSEDEQTYWMIALITFGFLFQATNVVDFYFQSQVQSKFAVRAQAIQLLISSIFKIYLVFNQAELIWFAFALMLDQAVVALLFLLVYHWKLEWFPFLYFKCSLATQLLKNSWPLIISGMMVSIYMKIDQIMIKEMLDAKAVGIYAAAVKLCEVLYFLPVATMTSLFPAVVESRNKSKTEYNRQVQRIYEMMLGAALIVAIIITFLSSWIVQFLYGLEFQETTAILQIYIWAFVFVSLGVVSSKWLVAENLHKYALIRSVIGVIINISSNWYLIPIYGIKGAALSTLITQIFVAYIFLLCFQSTRYNFWLVSRALTFGFHRHLFKKK
jgi:O-antigen/teichoic acid export membrane protein